MPRLVDPPVRPRHPRSLPHPPESSAQDAILDAAEELFARRGFTATTIKQIGIQARTNPALLYYYFQSKDGLYQAVLERLGGALIQRAQPALVRGQSPEGAVKKLVRAQAEFIREHPRAPVLIIRELVDHDARHAATMLSRVASQLFRRFAEVIEIGQRAGRFRSDLDPRFAAVSTIAQLVYFHVARAAIRVMLGENEKFPSPEMQRAFAEHAATFAIHALSLREGPGAAERAPGKQA